MNKYPLAVLKSALMLMIVIVVIVIWSGLSYVFIGGILDSETESSPESVSDSGSDYENCNVYGINLHGTLLTYVPEHAEGDSYFNYDVTSSESVTNIIRHVNMDPDMKAMVIEVDSIGGSPVAGEEIANAIKNSKKPVIAFIRDIGVSAAYWAISPADKILASRNSDVGGIGVTASYLSNAGNNQKEGYSYEVLSSGKYKDSGSPDKALTAEERALILRDVNIIHDNFVEDVSLNRDISREIVGSIADGSSVLGDKAKSLGLIDEIGGLDEAKAILKDMIGESPEICW